MHFILSFRQLFHMKDWSLHTNRLAVFKLDGQSETLQIETWSVSRDDR